MNMEISKKYTSKNLIKFSLPSIFMMIFMSLYTIIDGIFVARYVGSDGLSSLNILYPWIIIIFGIALMMGSGGSALVSKKIGEGDMEEGNNIFSLTTFILFILSIFISLLTIMFNREISIFLGANDALLKYTMDYLGIISIFFPFLVLQTLYQFFFVTVGKPRIGMILIVTAGITNMILDFVFVGLFKAGVSGAALATGIGQLIPAIYGSIYFFIQKKGLHFTKFYTNMNYLIQVCKNGISEMISQLSNTVVTIMFNVILLKIAEENGVAAITAILYGQFIFSAIFIGFTMGVSPIFGYFFGAKDYDEIKRIHKICCKFIFRTSFIIVIASFLASDLVMLIFFKQRGELFYLAKRGFLLYSLCYLVFGYNIYMSGVFTALSDGKTSAIISILRTLVFIVIFLLILPQIFGIDGVWLAVPVSEVLTSIVAHYYNKKIVNMK